MTTPGSPADLKIFERTKGLTWNDGSGNKYKIYVNGDTITTNAKIVSGSGGGTSFASLTLTAAASKIVPGATSLSLRNTADTRDNLVILDNGQYSRNIAIASNASTSQDVNLYTTQMPQLAAQFGASNAETFRAYVFNLESDTTANGYGGIMNTLIAHMDMVTVGATWSKVEAIAGVVNTKSSMVSGTVSDGYGTAGEILHAGGSTITTIRGLSGNVQITASGTIGTAFGTDSVVTTTLGQTGTVTVKAVGARSYVQINNVNAMQWAIGAENYVDLVAATTITTDVYGSFNYFQNTAAATISGNAYGSYDKVAITGALVTSGVVYGTFSQLLISGTAVGGTTNAALNAEAQWNSSSNPTGAVFAIQARARNSGTSAVVATLETIHVSAPVFANSGTATAHRGIHILNQGSASITTSTALLIDAQSGSSTNDALNILGGNVKFGVAFTSYNNINLGGNGIPSEVKVTRPATQTNTTVTLATYTTPAADGSYEIQANLNVTVSTTVTMTVTCSYTDEANVARVLTLPFFLLAGTLVQSITTAQGNIPYSSMPITIRTKASTSITIATAGTVTAVTYTGEGIIKQLA